MNDDETQDPTGFPPPYTEKNPYAMCETCLYAETWDTMPPYLSKIRDLSILPRILQEETPWWNLTLSQVADLLRQECDDFTGS